MTRILGMQQTLGNQAVQQRAVACPSFGACPTGGACHACPTRIQAKLTVGQPGDVYEQEADRVAEQVLRMPDPRAAAGEGISGPIHSPRIQRMCTKCEEELRRQPIEEEGEERLQAKEAPGHRPEVAPAVQAHVNSLRGGGQPLPESVRAFFQPRFGCEFSGVRIHSDARAADSARLVNARAYTVGRDLIFGAGQYRPETEEGRRLLAHELTHSIQQQSSTQRVSKKHPAAAGVNLGGRVLSPEQAEGVCVARKTPDAGITELNSHAEGSSALDEPRARAQLACVKRLGGSPETRPGGIPTRGEIADYNNRCRLETRYTGPDINPPFEERYAPLKTRTYALTFDDGPHAADLGKGENRTEKVLDTLQAKGIKAGFFIQTGVSYRGANREGRALVKRMHEEGHKVGIHTGGPMDHELHIDAERAGRLEAELKAAKEYVRKETRTTPELVRPPIGKFSEEVLKIYEKLDLTNLLWDIDGDLGKSLSLDTLIRRLESKDPSDPGIPAVYARGWKGTTPSHPKIVILYHDIQKGTADHLDDLIEHIKQVTRDVSDDRDTAEFAPP